MFIYVGGPYKAATNRRIQQNIENADQAGRIILKKNHIPFIPHTMMKNWEQGGMGEEQVRQVCHRWLERCDGFLYLGASPGADDERKLAEELGMEIFERLDQIPDNEGKEAPIEHKVTAYLTEYQQLQESYRHTYQTIWQAGAILIAASFLIIAFWDKSGGIRPISLVLASIPFLAWWLAIFRPMDGYGQTRRERLEKLEDYLNGFLPGLKLDHWRLLKSKRDEDKKAFENRKRWRKIFHKISRPKVHWAINWLGWGVVCVLFVFLILTILAEFCIGPYAP